MTEFMQATSAALPNHRQCRSCGSSLAVDPDAVAAWRAIDDAIKGLPKAAKSLDLTDVRMAREALHRAELLLVAAYTRADTKREALAEMRAAVSG